MLYPEKSFVPVPKKVESHYQARIRQFNDIGGQYRDLNLPHYFDRERIDYPSYIKLEKYSVPDLKRPLFKDAMQQAKDQWTPTKKGEWFGPSWSTHWFRISVKIPQEWHLVYKERPIFDFDSSNEGFLYTSKGLALQGLSGEHKRTEFRLPSKWAKDGQWHTFYIETSCNNIGGVGTPPDPDRKFRLNRADLVIPNEITRALNIDFWVLGDVAREFPANSWQKHKAIDLLNRIINTFDRNNVDESSSKCRDLAASYFGNINTSDVYSKKVKDAPILEDELVWAVGNCHIDTAWLWPFAETRRKIARSWSSQLDLLSRYPEYTFAASQAVQFQWLKEDHPHLFERIKIAVKDGRFIPIGGAWVECDGNMPNGEALIRQMWLGQRFFEREFGFRSKVFWLPDTFGYCPQLPQICRLAEQPYFLTQKLSWNNINKFPLSTFSWVGLDGSQVVCHMPPADTYTAEANLGDVKRSLEQHKNLDTSQHSLMLYGYGDGGGGPTAEMVEKLRRCRGISNEANQLPKLVTGEQYTPNKFFETIIANSHNGTSLVTWKGELYLEYHRGTYTTQAAIKRGNRRSEILMRDVELFATSASLKINQYSYPHDEIEELWRLVCLNQFHDVLPGSGIEMIYEDARRIYSEIWDKGSKLVKSALKALGYEPTDAQDPEALYVVDIDENLSGYQDALITAAYDAKVPCDFDLMSKTALNEFELYNESFIVKFNKGSIISIFDKRVDREVLAPDSIGNNFILFEDQPMNFPAWDTEQYASEKYQELKPKAWKQHDEICAEITWQFSKSKIHQKVVLHRSYVEFDTKVDWRETYQFLKVQFPVDIMNDSATYETAFGLHKRPTHFNTSWDAAKFEVNGHRFADLSDWNYGVTLLNDCKYGYSIHGNQMRLSLLRSPKSPDANADMGTHQFRYALAPHEGPLRPEIIRLAQYFNHPHYWAKDPKFKRPDLRGNRLFPHIVMIKGDPSIFVSSVKRADADKGTNKSRAVVRVYESMGGQANGYLSSLLPLKSATEVNILEDESGDQAKQLDVLMAEAHEEEQDRVYIHLGPFEVKSILLEFL